LRAVRIVFVAVVLSVVVLGSVLSVAAPRLIYNTISAEIAKMMRPGDTSPRTVAYAGFGNLYPKTAIFDADEYPGLYACEVGSDWSLVTQLRGYGRAYVNEEALYGPGSMKATLGGYISMSSGNYWVYGASKTAHISGGQVPVKLWYEGSRMLKATITGCETYPCAALISTEVDGACWLVKGDSGSSGGGGGGGGSSPSPDVAVFFWGVGLRGGVYFFPWVHDVVRYGGNGTSVSWYSGSSHRVGISASGGSVKLIYLPFLEYNRSGYRVGFSVGYAVVGGKYPVDVKVEARLSRYFTSGSGTLYLWRADGGILSGKVWGDTSGYKWFSVSAYVNGTWVPVYLYGGRFTATVLRVRFRAAYGDHNRATLHIYTGSYRDASFRYMVVRHSGQEAKYETPTAVLALERGVYDVYVYFASTARPRGFYVVPGGLVYVSNLTGVGEPVVRPLTGPAGDVEFTVYMGGDFEAGRFRPDGGALRGYRESMYMGMGAEALTGVEALVFGHPGEMAALLATNTSTLYLHDNTTELVYDVSGIRFAITPVELRVLSVERLGDSYNITFELVPLYLDGKLGSDAPVYPGGAGGLA